MAEIEDTSVIPEVIYLFVGRGKGVEKIRSEGFASKLALFNPQASVGLKEWDLDTRFGFARLETKHVNENTFNDLLFGFQAS